MLTIVGGACTRAARISTKRFCSEAAGTLQMSVWAQVEQLGFQRGALLDALRGRHQTKAAVAYYLLLDSRRRSMGSGAYLRAELSSACEALMQNPLGGQPRC